jgi:hypothetical protein
MELAVGLSFGAVAFAIMAARARPKRASGCGASCRLR